MSPCRQFLWCVIFKPSPCNRHARDPILKRVPETFYGMDYSIKYDIFFLVHTSNKNKTYFRHECSPKSPDVSILSAFGKKCRFIQEKPIIYSYIYHKEINTLIVKAFFQQYISPPIYVTSITDKITFKQSHVYLCKTCAIEYRYIYIICKPVIYGIYRYRLIPTRCEMYGNLQKEQFEYFHEWYWHMYS